MTDAAIADTINRHVARKIAAHLDSVDLGMPIAEIRWQHSAMAESLAGENKTSDGDRAWLVGFIAARVPDVAFDGTPADSDWENLFSHLRAEIVARRDPKSPLVRAAQTPCGMV
jgi:hypothetical protein